MAVALVVQVGHRAMVRAGLGMCEIDLGTMNAAYGAAPKPEHPIKLRSTPLDPHSQGDRMAIAKSNFEN